MTQKCSAIGAPSYSSGQSATRNPRKLKAAMGVPFMLSIKTPLLKDIEAELKTWGIRRSPTGIGTSVGYALHELKKYNNRISQAHSWSASPGGLEDAIKRGRDGEIKGVAKAVRAQIIEIKRETRTALSTGQIAESWVMV